jgi:hypothetical protein
MARVYADRQCVVTYLPDMDADTTLARLGLDPADDDLADALWLDRWPASQAARPEGVPLFLQPDEIRRRRQYAGLPADVEPTLLRAAATVNASAELTALAWHAQFVLYEFDDFPAHANTRRWPERIDALGDDTAALWLLLGFEALPRMLARHAERRIPADVSADCCAHFPASLQRFADHHDGRAGMRAGALYWLKNHVRGDLIRLGRLEYMVKPFGGRVVAWRHRDTRAVIALAEGGSYFDAEGILTDGQDSAAWTASLAETDAQVTGHPVSPEGFGRSDRVTLSRPAWEPVLRRGDPILEVHIPAGGGMTPAACQESMARAVEFFPRHFPERPFVGFACGSWILNPQLHEIYRPGRDGVSNMVLWQRQLYLFPLVNGPDTRSGLTFVFGVPDVDPATAPRDTSLRRALLEHIDGGGRLLGGGMFLLLEEFARYGQQPYRAQWSAGPPV